MGETKIANRYVTVTLYSLYGNRCEFRMEYNIIQKASKNILTSEERFADNKGVIRSRKSKKYRQHNKAMY